MDELHTCVEYTDFEAYTDRAAYEDVIRGDSGEVDNAPTDEQRIGPFTVMALMLNRTIGTGIFLTPARILRGTGSVGVSLLFWTFGGFYGASGLSCWLQFGLSIPYFKLPSGDLKNVPRSGGEKNYFEFLFPRPRFLATCMYGVPFILLANLSGNAIAFGIQVMRAAGYSDPSHSAVIGLAIGVLTLCISVHIFSRRGGLVVNNIFAIMKVLTLMTIIILGFVKAGGRLSSPSKPTASHNFNVHNSFSTNRHDVGSYVHSMFYVCYSYSGFEQPFYVLSEVKHPRKVFPRYTPIAMAITATLYILVNVAYLCAVSKESVLDDQNPGMASMFFENVFGNERAERAMAAVIALSAFGNLLVQTFTAARVKQEIAKEGILPFARFFAAGQVTPWEWLKNRLLPSRSNSFLKQGAAKDMDSHPENAPIGALVLHFLSSIFLVAVTSMLKPETSYSFLISLYSYVMMGVSGFIVSGGLLYLNLNRNLHKNESPLYWRTIRNHKPRLGILPALLYFIANGVFLFAAFARPEPGSPFSQEKSNLPPYLVPAIGLSVVFWGLFWYSGLKLVERLRHRTLEVLRMPFICPVDPEHPDEDWIQKSEWVVMRWAAGGVDGSISLRTIV